MVYVYDWGQGYVSIPALFFYGNLRISAEITRITYYILHIPLVTLTIERLY